MDENKPGFLQFDRDGETSPRRLAVLVGAGVVALLLLLWLFRDPAPEADRAPPVNAPPPAAEPVATQSQPAPTNSVAELRLHGVMGIGDSGSAIISTGAGPQRLVRVGRNVIPGVPLLAVAGDHVLLRENGREVRLAFADDANGGAAATPSGASSEPDGRNSPEARRESREYQAALAPARIDGRHAGYRFRADRMPELFQSAGITPDDIILRVGGLGLEDADDVAGIPERMRERGTFDVEIIRDGQEQTITIDGR
ncbi:hypothetical protein HFP51_07530 [Parasphingopyxis sp. CP4]|uniref:type II secretion system protein N n=1 Tax=Parasphingopyxis sp. CP4 TaxID=2724527 RepID=UPI0015A02C4D|nr:type II secretion system protein N [Parasphingopyxis sp. CP4]QLC22044.1 hypothetical protein HFP51_07530 [Parasphingopyxis sp. CP4]